MLLAALENDQDREYFLRIHKELEERLYGLAVLFLGDQHRAEEAVQETWVRVIQRFEEISVKPWGELQGYVLMMTKNISRNILRRDKRLSPLPEDWDIPAPEAGEDGFHRLVALIRAMPEGYRDVLELKFVMEWSNKEIARELGLNESTVATRIQRGREKLVGVLRKEGYENEWSRV